MENAFGQQRDYMDSVMSLVNTSTNFLDNLRISEIKYLTPSASSRLTKMIGLVGNAEQSSVADIKVELEDLDEKLGNLVKKFQIIKSSYKSDVTLNALMGDVTTNPKTSYKQLENFIDSSISQIDVVITAYSQIEKKTAPAKQWALTILSHQSSPKARGKARTSNQIIKALETLIGDLRTICHNTKLDLLNLRGVVSKYTKPVAE